MPEFIYSAKSGPKEVVRGRLSAPTRQEAVRQVEEKGLVPIEVTEAEPPSSPNAFVGDRPGPRLKHSGATPQVDSRSPIGVGDKLRGNDRKFSFGRRVSLYEICVFTRQLSSFMRSQVPLLSALEFIKNETPARSKLKTIMVKIADEVRDGKRFSDALEEYGSPHFDTRFISMIRSGESSGHLDDILETLANSLEAEEEIRGQIKSALAYPALVITAGAGTIFFLLTFAIPRLAGLFNQTFKTLPLATKILMSLSQPKWQAVIMGVFGAMAALVLFFVFGGVKNKKMLDGLIIRLPLLGKLRLKADIARFCGTLGMLIDSGVPIYQAIEVTRPVLANEILKEELKDAQSRILGGEMFARIIRELPHFPPFVSQMIAVGEDSGRLAESLKEVSRFYSRESLRGIKTITLLIEPLLMLGLSLVVGFIVAGIMLPIFNMDWVK